ncbi:MAG: tetratricopeptide repeat protein [Thermoguttaceae bacterium]
MFVFVAVSVTGCRLTNPLRPLTDSFRQSGEQSRAGHTAIERQDWEAAERYLGNAVRLDKNDPTLRLHYGEALWNQGKRNESLEQLHEAARLSKGRDAVIQASLAEKLLEVGQLDTALKCAETATLLAPKDFRGWLLLGRGCVVKSEVADTQGRQGESQDWLIRARDCYYRATSLASDTRPILPQLAALQMKMRQPEYALASWQTLQDSYDTGTEPAEVLCGKASVLASMNRYREAIEAYTTAFEREPHRTDIANNIAACERQVGRDDLADNWVRTAAATPNQSVPR